MELKLILLFTFYLSVFKVNADRNVFCYYDSRSMYRDDIGKMNLNAILPGLQHCTHLIYGFAGINPENYTLMPLHPVLDIKLLFYKGTVNLKYHYPELKVLLSVGGNADEHYPEKYLTLLESNNLRENFVKDTVNLLKQYGFDGIDLAWQFPTIPPKIARGKIAKVWHAIKRFFVGEKQIIVDIKEQEHKTQFTDLLSRFNKAFKVDNLMLTTSVLPNVNSTAYFDIQTISNYVDFVNLWTFDFYTPQRNPTEANYPSSLYEVRNSRPFENADYVVSQWLESGMPSHKVIFGISTFARTWKVTKGSYNGMLPLKVDGPGDAGPYSLESGFLSYTEICLKLANQSDNSLEKFYDPRNLHDRYGENGLWGTYDMETKIAIKGNYVKNKRLGGIAVYDLSMDDFSGACANKYPLLRKAKLSLYQSTNF